MADLLRHDIHGTGAGWKLPSEDDLIRSFGVSRNTVRVALAALRDEGLLQRKTGVGTVTKATSERHQLDLTRIPSSTLFGSQRLERQVLVAELRPAPPPLASLLGIAPGDETLLIEKVVLLDGVPLYRATDWLRSFVANGMLASDLRQETSEILVSLGHPLGQMDSALEAVLATDADADALGVAEGAPLLMLEIRLHLADGTPVECSFVRLRADRLTIGATLTPRAMGITTERPSSAPSVA